MRTYPKLREILIVAAIIAVSLTGLAEVWNQARCRMLLLRIRLDQQQVERYKTELQRTEAQRRSDIPYPKADRTQYLQENMFSFGVDYPNSWAEESQGLQQQLDGYRRFVSMNEKELAEIKRSMLFP